MERECRRYGLDPQRVARTLTGEDAPDHPPSKRSKWELLAPVAALSLLVILAAYAHRPNIAFNAAWMLALIAATLLTLGVGGMLLWRRTRFF